MDTFNFNFGSCHKTRDVLDFEFSEAEIEALPDAEVIIGSPPCVSFSSSNTSSRADKVLGVRLIKTFLRIVAVKKHQRDSVLQAWFMENVERSRKHLADSYTFSDLDLDEWAQANGIEPTATAMVLKDNGIVLNAADYGTPQSRKRFFSGELIPKGKFIVPSRTHTNDTETCFTKHITIKRIRAAIPSPNDTDMYGVVVDPNYPTLMLGKADLTDHYYDTGIYEVNWQNSKILKTDHGFMGKMAFPEDESRPIRTVMATNIGSSRESIIFRSEYDRKGDGEYRTLTVREAAIFMGFPINYQFIGLEPAKWPLVGNAVCPPVSRALAKEVRAVLGLEPIEIPLMDILRRTDIECNLNGPEPKRFDSPPTKNKGAKFRKHSFKDGNMTVTLSNYDMKEKTKPDGEWKIFVLYGTGKGYGIDEFKKHYYKELEQIIRENFQDGAHFINRVNNGFSEVIAPAHLLQEMYEKQASLDDYLEPRILIEKAKAIINEYAKQDEKFLQNGKGIFRKPIVPKRQLYSLYAMNKIISHNSDQV